MFERFRRNKTAPDSAAKDKLYEDYVRYVGRMEEEVDKTREKLSGDPESLKLIESHFLVMDKNNFFKYLDSLSPFARERFVSDLEIGYEAAIERGSREIMEEVGKYMSEWIARRSHPRINRSGNDGQSL